MEILSPRRQSLTIEARHTISLEVAKQRRLKVASSLFLPSKPMRQIIPISIEHEKQIVNPTKKAKISKKERSNPVEETLLETKEAEKKTTRPRKRAPSASKELQKQKGIPSKQILFLAGKVKIDNLALPKQTRTTRSEKEEPSYPKETPTIPSEPVQGEEDKSPFCKEVVSTAKKGKDVTHRSSKEEASSNKANISEVLTVLTRSTSSKVSKERKSSSYKPVLSPSSQSQKGKDVISSFPKEIPSSFSKKKEKKERKKSTSDSEKGKTVISKDILHASRKEKDSEFWGDKEESLDKYNLSEKSILSESVSSSPTQVEIEAEILPTTTTADTTAEKVEAEILPTTTTTDRTPETVEAEILPTTTASARTSEKFEVEILTTTTTTDRTAGTVEAEILPTTSAADTTAEKVEAEILPTTTTTDRTPETVEAEIVPTTTAAARTADKFEAEILTTTTTTDRTAGTVEAEILPTTSAADTTAEKVEAEILPTTTTTDRTAETVEAENLPTTTTTDRTAGTVEAEILPTTSAADTTAEKVEAEILPTTTTTDRTAETVEAENLPTTTTTDRTAETVEVEILPTTTTTDRTPETVEAENLPTTTTTDRTAETVEAEFLPTTTAADTTAEKVEAENLPTTTTTDRTAETVEVEILPTTTTTTADRIAKKVQILSETIINESKKRSPLKQILFRTRIAEFQMSNLFRTGNKETLSRARKMDEQMETAEAAEQMTISDKETPVVCYPESAPQPLNSSTSANAGVYILNTDHNNSQQFQVPKPHNVHFVTKTTPQCRNLVQYYQGRERPQATSMQMPTNVFQSPTHKTGVYVYEGPRLPHTKNMFVQKSSTSHRKCASEEHTIHHRSRRDASDKVEYITRYYNDKPMDCRVLQPGSRSNSYGLNDMRYQPYDLSQRRPREFIQQSQFAPELPVPAAPHHNQQQSNQGLVPVQVHSANLQPNFTADWISSMNAQTQIALANTVIQPAQEMPSTSYPSNLPQWLQQSINSLKVNAPAINIPVAMVQSTCHQTPALCEHQTQTHMGRWIQPSITQGPFEPMNQHQPMQQWPNNCITYQKYTPPFGNPNFMHQEPEMPAAMSYPNIIQGCNSCCPVLMNSPSGNRERSTLGAPNSQPQISHDAPRARPPYAVPSIYQADSTTGGNSPPLPSANMPRTFIEPLKHYPGRPTFYKPETQRPSQLPYPRVNTYPSFGHGHGSLNNMPEYDPRRNC